MRQKLFALAMAVIMLIALAAPLGAAASSVGKITITGVNEDFGHEFKAYKIFEDTATGDSHNYVLTSKFEPFVTAEATKGGEARFTDSATFVDYVYGLADADVGAQDRALQKLIGELVDFIGENSVDEDAIGGSVGIGENAVEFTGLGRGYFLVVGISEYDADGRAVAFFALKPTTEDVVIALTEKVDWPDITKEIENGDDPADPQKWTSATIGTYVDFLLTTNVPLNVNAFDEYIFIVHDRMSKGLTASPGSLVVKVGTTDYKQPSALYSVTESCERDRCEQHRDGDGTSTICVAFAHDGLAALTPGAQIEIRFKALLNEDAVIIPDNEINIVFLEYSDSPDTTEDTRDDDAKVYSFKLDVYKYTGSNLITDHTPLAGAKFQLRAGTVDGDLIYFTDEGGGDYRVAEIQDGLAGRTATMTSLTDGKINVEGLGAGTYWLIETEAPEEYKAHDPIEIVIEHDTEGVPTITWDSKPLANVGGDGVVPVLNTRDNDLPGTGGIGRTIFIVVGLTMMAGAAVLLIVRKKISKSKA